MHKQSTLPQNRDATRPAGGRNATTRVAVLGLGYVGLPLAILAESKGYRITGYDVDPVKVATLKRRDAGFLSEEEAKLFKKSRMVVTTHDERLRGADVYIVCVPTPVDLDHAPDLRPLARASYTVGRNLSPGALVIIESTVNPGVCESIALPIIERTSGLKAEKDFYYAHCPERVNPGDLRWTTRTIPRVVGASGPESLSRAVDFYSSIVDAEVRPMGSIKEAEAVKMVENSFRDVNIAFVNELAMSFALAGIDVMRVIDGAATKPFGFMPHYPGCGVGGHCIPVDPYYLIRYGRENGFEHEFLVTARKINSGMPRYTVELAAEELHAADKKLAGSTIALLGLSYKRDIPDLRESPALEIRKELIERDATVHAFDPFIPEESNVRSLHEALRGADAVIVATDHSLLRTLTPEDLKKYNIGVLIDGRNCLPKEAFADAGIAYRGIGS